MFEQNSQNNIWKSAAYFITVGLGVFAVSFSILYVLGLVPDTFKTAEQQAADIDGEAFGDFLNYERPENYVIGTTRPDYISIPKIGVNSVVGQPNTQNIAILDQFLTQGAVHYPGSGTVEAGNVFLFGHSSGLANVRNQAYKVFNNLNKLASGDEIYLEADGRRYVYKVESVQLIDENAALVSFENRARTLTISTCNTFGAKQERWVVEAVFDREV